MSLEWRNKLRPALPTGATIAHTFGWDTGASQAAVLALTMAMLMRALLEPQTSEYDFPRYIVCEEISASHCRRIARTTNFRVRLPEV
jgi:hypothetical protein